MFNNFQAVILAGGFGTRLGEETYIKPKPLVEIGGKPILWHIMKYYSSFGVRRFIVCAGYKSETIKNYFQNYKLINSKFTRFSVLQQEVNFLDDQQEDWIVDVVDTGTNSGTGKRIKAVSHLIEGTFFLTYGDAVTDLNLINQYKFHQDTNSILTVASVIPESRYGVLKTNNSGLVESFKEKEIDMNYRINGGFFICEPEVMSFIDDSDSVMFEEEPIADIVKTGRFFAFEHDGFWRNMDTLRDKQSLEKMWDLNKPWQIWR